MSMILIFLAAMICAFIVGWLGNELYRAWLVS